MKAIEALREKVREQIKEHELAIYGLQRELAALNSAFAAVSGESLVSAAVLPVAPANGRQNIKKVVMAVIEEFEQNAFTAAEVVNRALIKGRSVQLASVRSMLSRLKAAGALRFEDGRYFTPQKGNPFNSSVSVNSQGAGPGLFRVA